MGYNKGEMERVEAMAQSWREWVGMVAADYPELEFRAGEWFSYQAPGLIRYEELAPGAANGDHKNYQGETGLDERGNDNAHKNYDAQTGQGEGESGDVYKNYQVLQMKMLHELGHAELGHKNYTTDVERVKMEREAWARAVEIALRHPEYGVVIDDDVAEEGMESYREWLQRQAKCPECGSVRMQGVDGIYRCPVCDLLYCEQPPI